MKKTTWICNGPLSTSCYTLYDESRKVVYHDGLGHLMEINYWQATLDLKDSERLQLRARILALLFHDDWPLADDFDLQFGGLEKEMGMKLYNLVRKEIDELEKNEATYNH